MIIIMMITKIISVITVMLTTIEELWGQAEAKINSLQIWSLLCRYSVGSPCPPPLPVFAEMWRISDDGGRVGGSSSGRLRVRTRLKSKSVFVTEPRKESRGGQCADHTRGRVIHQPLTPPVFMKGPPLACSTRIMSWLQQVTSSASHEESFHSGR